MGGPGSGRLTDYTPEMGRRVCDAIATHALSIADICELEPDFPSRAGVYLWLTRYPDFGEMFDKAREHQAELWLEDAMEIADDIPDADSLTAVTRAKLRTDIRMRVIPLLNRRKYGQKVALTGGDPGDAPLTFADVSDRERAKALALLVAKAKASAPDE